jgi:hypothetical protein
MDLIKKPSFTFGYYRPWNKDADFVESWLDYNKDNQRSQYVTGMIINGVKEVNKENINCLNQINSNLSQGFNAIQNELSDINNTLEIGFYELNKNQIKEIQLTIATNILLEEVKILNSLSDSEKERFQFVRDGLKFISNVNKDSEYYDDAFRCFSKAVELKITDYLSLFFLGYISTFSKKHFNPNNAIEFFKKGLKYAVIDDGNEIKVLNDFYTKIDGQLSGMNLIDSMHLLLSQCYYLANDIEQALKFSLEISENSFIKNFTSQLKYASRIKDSVKIESIVNKIFDKNIENYEDVLCDFDVLNNIYTLNTIKNIINNIEIKYDQLKQKYQNSEDSYEIIQVINSEFQKENNVINKKRIINFYTEDYINSEISKQIEFEKNMNSDTIEIGSIYSEYLEIKNKFNSSKSEINNKALRLRGFSDLGENIVLYYTISYIAISILIVIYVFYNYPVATAIGYNIVIIICEIILYFIGLFLSGIIGTITNGVVDFKLKNIESKSKNITESNEVKLKQLEKDLKDKKSSLKYYIDKHQSYQYSKPYEQKINKIKI